MNIKFNEKQLHYLKRYAALQFAGSAGNYSSKSPIHFLQKKAGEAALAEETGNVCTHMEKHMNNDEIFKELKEHPNEAFTAVDCRVSCKGSLNCTFHIKISIVGIATVLSNGAKIINATRFVSMKKDGKDEKKFRYPFEHDPYFKKMAKAKNVIKVMNYGRYI